MYMIVLLCGMVLVHTLHMICLVSVMNAALSEISLFCLSFNVTRLSLCKSGEKRESSIYVFAHKRKSRFRQQGCVLLSKRIRMNNDHAAHQQTRDLSRPDLGPFGVRTCQDEVSTPSVYTAVTKKTKHMTEEATLNWRLSCCYNTKERMAETLQLPQTEKM